MLNNLGNARPLGTMLDNSGHRSIVWGQRVRGLGPEQGPRLGPGLGPGDRFCGGHNPPSAVMAADKTSGVLQHMTSEWYRRDRRDAFGVVHEIAMSDEESSLGC